MDKARGTTQEEFDDVIKLINKIFRCNRNCKPTMELEFPLLLTRSNAENMRIIEKDNMPVSCANFVKRNMYIDGSEILVASIGAVCTEDEYRGRGYSSLILDDVEEKMESEGVDVTLVSGTRALYQRRGYTITRNFIKYEILPDDIELKYELKEYEENKLIEVAKLYNMKSTRYDRNMDDFQKLIKSALFPWGNISYKKYLLVSDGIDVGYIFIKIFDGKEKQGKVVESCGRADYIEDGLKKIAYINGLKSIEYRVNIRDKVNYLKNFHRRELDFQEGTVKIINFISFMEKLKSYFSNYITSDILKEIKFEVIERDEEKQSHFGKGSCEASNKSYIEKNNENDDVGLKGFKFNVSEEILKHIDVVDLNKTYRIIYKDEILEINDIWTLNKLVFEGSMNLNLDFKGKKQIESFINKVFPIPFVYSANLNYQ